MTGMSITTGRALADRQHLAQSIADILTTPLGSRVMRREYGSLLPDLIDEPNNTVTLIRLYAATTVALLRWEPRILLTRLTYQVDGPRGVLDLEGEEVATGQSLSLRVPLQMGSVA